MKVLLVRMPAFDAGIPPLNLPYLRAALRARGLDATILDLNAEAFRAAGKEIRNRYWSATSYALWNSAATYAPALPPEMIEEWRRRAVALRPDLVGFSLYNTNLAPTLELAAPLKDAGAKIVLGGQYCRRENGVAANLLRHPFVDAVVAGEGEESFAELVENYRNGSERPCRGVLARTGGKVIDGGVRPPAALDDIPFPDFSGLDRSLYPEPLLPMLASRGCINRCAYCNDYPFWGGFRHRSAGNIVAEMEGHISSTGIGNFVFLDLLINGDLKELERMCRSIISLQMKLRKRVTWSAFAAVRRMSGELLDLLRLSGCMGLYFGLESGSERNLRLVRKKTDLAYAEELFKACHGRGMEVSVGWIIGFPGETQDDFEETVRFAKRIRPWVRGFLPAAPLTAHPGSDLWAHPGAYGITSIHPTDWKRWEDGVNSQETREARLERFNTEVGAYYAQTSPAEGRGK